MTEHTRRLLERCVERLEDYIGGKTDLKTLVAFLERSLDAMEEKLPSAFYDEWF